VWRTYWLSSWFLPPPRSLRPNFGLRIRDKKRWVSEHRTNGRQSAFAGVGSHQSVPPQIRTVRWGGEE